MSCELTLPFGGRPTAKRDHSVFSQKVYWHGNSIIWAYVFRQSHVTRLLGFSGKPVKNSNVQADREIGQEGFNASSTDERTISYIAWGWPMQVYVSTPYKLALITRSNSPAPCHVAKPRLFCWFVLIDHSRLMSVVQWTTGSAIGCCVSQLRVHNKSVLLRDQNVVKMFCQPKVCREQISSWWATSDISRWERVMNRFTSKGSLTEWMTHLSTEVEIQVTNV